MRWLVESGDHTYGASLWPLVMMVAAAIGGSASGIWLLNRIRDWPSRMHSGRFLVIAPAVLLPLFGSCLPFVAWCEVPSASQAETSRAHEVFAGLILLESAVTVGGLMVLAGFAVARALRQSRPDAPRTAAPVLGMAVSAALLLAGLGHATLLTGLGDLPTISVDGLSHMHVGSPVAVSAHVDDLPGWSPPATVTVDRTTPGEREARFESAGPLLWVSRTARIAVGEDEPCEAFPLAVGHHWVFEYRDRPSARGLFGLVGDCRRAGTIEVKVISEREHAGLHLYDSTLEVRETACPATVPSDMERVSQLRMYSMDGQVYAVDEHGREEPLFRRAGPEGEVLDPFVPTLAQSEPFYFWFFGAPCNRITAPPDGPPAPDGCDVETSRVVERAFWSTLFTAGLFTWMGERSDYALKTSSFAPVPQER